MIPINQENPSKIKLRKKVLRRLKRDKRKGKGLKSKRKCNQTIYATKES